MDSSEVRDILDKIRFFSGVFGAVLFSKNLQKLLTSNRHVNNAIKDRIYNVEELNSLL